MIEISTFVSSAVQFPGRSLRHNLTIFLNTYLCSTEIEHKISGFIEILWTGETGTQLFLDIGLLFSWQTHDFTTAFFWRAHQRFDYVYPHLVRWSAISAGGNRENSYLKTINY